MPFNFHSSIQFFERTFPNIQTKKYFSIINCEWRYKIRTNSVSQIMVKINIWFKRRISKRCSYQPRPLPAVAYVQFFCLVLFSVVTVFSFLVPVFPSLVLPSIVQIPNHLFIWKLKGNTNIDTLMVVSYYHTREVQ